MSNPLQNNRLSDRPGTEEKITAILDLLGIIARTLLGIFGKRKKDSQPSS
jgi:hypothetical protein